MVRDLPGELAAGKVLGIGLFCGGALRGVAAWRLYPSTPLARSDVVAVTVGHQGKGYGRRLKEGVLTAAYRAGAIALVSLVDRRNETMIRLNKKLGGRMELLEEDDDNCRFFFRLPAI